MREYCCDIHFVCFEAHVLAEKQFSFKLIFITQLRHGPGVPNTPPAGRMWPARTFYETRDASREFLYNQDLSHSVYSPVFGSSRPASEQVPFERT